jgi:type I restriction enzyme M protein
MIMGKQAKSSIKKENDNVITTSAQLFSYLSKASDILHGPINRDEYKSYIMPLLFFKRLSDVYDEKREKAISEYGEDFLQNHRFTIPDTCHWDDIREKSDDIGQAITEAMQGIENANPDTLNGVFSSFDDAVWTDKKKLTDARLKNLIEHFSKIKVGNDNYTADVMGDAYEYLIKRFADLSKKNAGEFYTPRSIVKLMVMLLKPKAGETVYDPATGTGGMLIEAIRYMNDDRKAFGKIYGQEKKLANSAIAQMNLFLHGADDFHIMQGDTLRNPYFIDKNTIQTFDCVIANPPFSLENWGANAFMDDKWGRNIWGCPTDENGDFAWLQHMVKSMDETNGRLAVVLYQGVLTRKGLEGEMRKKLVKTDKLQYIITLKGGIFYSTPTPACILVLNNNKPEYQKNKVCMIDALEIYTPQRAQKFMSEENIKDVYSLCMKYENVVEKAKIVSLEEIKNNGFSLSVRLYTDKKAKEKIDPDKLKREFFATIDEAKKCEDKLTSLIGEYYGQ